MVHMGQKLFGLTLVAVLLLAAADGRPPYFEPTNEIEKPEPGLTYNPFYPYPGYNRYPDNQYEKLRIFFEGQDSKPGSGSAVETLYREPESKRQAVRYRQCYFNPISCFRK